MLQDKEASDTEAIKSLKNVKKELKAFCSTDGYSVTLETSSLYKKIFWLIFITVLFIFCMIMANLRLSRVQSSHTDKCHRSWNISFFQQWHFAYWNPLMAESQFYKAPLYREAWKKPGRILPLWFQSEKSTWWLWAHEYFHEFIRSWCDVLQIQQWKKCL